MEAALFALTLSATLLALAATLLVLLTGALSVAALLARLSALLILLSGPLTAALLLTGLSTALLLLPWLTLLVAAIALILVHEISPCLHSGCCFHKGREVASFRSAR